MWSAGQGDNQERFLADLRALRDTAAIGFDELAARAHYPSNILKEAENGPGLPGLPILAAYVRACDADVPEWEERWRRLADVETDPGLPVRPPGASPAAVAGARAGVSVAPPDAYDPERIRAALRGGTADRGPRPARDIGAARTAAAGRVDPDPGHTDVVTPEGPATWSGRSTGWGDRDTGSWSGSSGPVTAWDTTPNWGTSDSAPTNGNHHPTFSGSVFDAAVTESFGSGTAAVAEEDPVPAWLADSEVAAPAEAERLWPEQEETEPAGWSVDGQVVPPVTAETQPLFPQDARYTETAGAPGVAESAQDAESPEVSGYAGSVGFAQDAAYSGAVGFAQGSESTEVAGSARDVAPAGFADVGPIGFAATVGSSPDAEATGYARSAGAAREATQPVRPPMAAMVPDRSRRDKYFPLRLAAVMVIAAIIGSILVLVIR